MTEGVAEAKAEAGLTVWYDGGCPLCAREIALMRRLDSQGQVCFVDLETTQDTPLPRAVMLERFHVSTPDGTTQSGAAAFARLWRSLPALRPVGQIAAWPPLLAVLEGAYSVFLRIRPLLQRLVRRWDARSGTARP